MQCDYVEMDWHCVLQKGHKGEHKSHSLETETDTMSLMANLPIPGGWDKLRGTIKRVLNKKS